MATIENNYTGDGSTVLFPFTFEYIDAQDVKVQLDGTDTTAYTLDNATTVRLTTAPAVGVAVRVYRETGTDSMPATFFSGSTIQANDLNDNFQVALYVSQEAQAASADAADALPVATAAQAAAAAAVTTANQAAADAQTANNAALTASTNASTALTTANAASTAATNAESTANAAAALVASANLPTSVANVAAIPGSPSDNDLVEVRDSTGIGSFTPLAGLPVGFVGDAGIATKIVYSSSGSTWNFVEYRPTDPDDRYTTSAEVTAITNPIDAKADQGIADAASAAATADIALPLAGGTMTGPITFAAGQSFGIGTGNGTTEGIVQLSDATDSTSDTTGGVAATPSAVKSAYDRATTAINTANNANTNANGRLSSSGGTITGNLTVTGFIRTNTGGASDSPSIRFDDDNTGLYYASSINNGAVRFTKNGVVQWSFSSDRLVFNAGEGDIQSEGESNRGYYLSGRGRSVDDWSQFKTASVSSSNRVLRVRGNNDETVFYANGSAKNSTGTWGTLSDARKKTNITDANEQWDQIKDWHFVNYELTHRPGDKYFGVIAQEMQQVSPGLVDEDPDGWLSVKTSVMSMMGLKALQEAMARIEQLEARIAELEG